MSFKDFSTSQKTPSKDTVDGKGKGAPSVAQPAAQSDKAAGETTPDAKS